MIPTRPNLEFDRKQAKALLQAVKLNQPEATARFRQHHPRGMIDHPKLADAQIVVAREYGFPSWPQWKSFVETRALSRKEQASIALKASCSNDVRRARTLLQADPLLVQEDRYLACAYGNAAKVRKAIAADSEWVTKKGGVNDWEPLQYACFSRWLQVDSVRAEEIVQIARILLTAGADPNSHHIEDLAGMRGGRWCFTGRPASPITRS